MNRIETCFQKRRAQGRKVLVGYLTAGDPDMAASEADIRAAVAEGVDILELGVPFSDPTADGPVIQAAAFRSLQAGTTTTTVLELVRRLRRDLATPIVLFGYANPVFVYGFERYCRDAAAAGADGLLIVDLPHEEAGELRAAAARHGLALIPLIAPTTPKARAAAILAEATGFVYYILFRGVTGARHAVADDAAAQIQTLREVTALPIAAGFGVSDGAQARAVAGLADGVVVGSALVKAAREGRLSQLVRELRAAL